MPSTATTMSAGLFNNATNITSVTFHNTFTTIPNNAFKGCTGLQSVAFTATSSVSSIGDSAFENCNNASFTQIALPASIQTVGSSVFKNCTAPATVTIGSALNGSSLTNVGENAFENISDTSIPVYKNSQTDFNTITIHASVTILSFLARIIISGNNLESWPNAEGPIDIPTSVVTMSDGVFNGNTNITSVIIPNTLTAISNNAFKDCWTNRSYFYCYLISNLCR